MDDGRLNTSFKRHRTYDHELFTVELEGVVMM